jgi:hypothetical protein
MRLKSCGERSAGVRARNTGEVTDRSNAGVVCKHETAYTVVHWNVRTLLRESHLNARRTPGDECSKTTFSDTEQTLVNVCGINLSLDDVEDGDIATLFAGVGRDHAVLWLKETTHDVEHGGLADRLGLFDYAACEGSVRGHEEMAAWRWDEGSNNAD